MGAHGWPEWVRPTEGPGPVPTCNEHKSWQNPNAGRAQQCCSHLCQPPPQAGSLQGVQPHAPHSFISESLCLQHSAPGHLCAVPMSQHPPWEATEPRWAAEESASPGSAVCHPALPLLPSPIISLELWIQPARAF